MNLPRTLLAAIATLNLAAAGCYGYDPNQGTMPGARNNGRPGQGTGQTGQPTADPGEQAPPAGMDTTPRDTPPDPTRDPTMNPPPDTTPPDTTPPDPGMPTTPPDTMPPPPPPAGPGPDAMRARMLFDMNVAPIITMKCGTTACHAPPGSTPVRFLTAAATDLYASVTSYSLVVGNFTSATAPILTKIAGGHFTTYTAVEISKIAEWLDLEKTARMQGGTPPPTGPGTMANALIGEWSGCMDLTQWNNTGVARAFANMNSQMGPCIRCHVNGYESFIANPDSQRVFEVLTTQSEYMLRYFTPNLTAATPAMQINRDLFVKVATGVAPYIEHPRFNQNDPGFTALTNFFNQTMARKTANTCAAPRLQN